MFAALIAKTDVDLIALDKGEISARSVVDDLISKMEQYANFGFDYIQEQLDNDPNYFFKETAFLRVFTSFLNNEEKVANSNDEPDPLDEMEPDSLDDFQNENCLDEETMRAEAEKPWDQFDIEKLTMFFEHKMEINKIAERLGKSTYSVRFQLSQLGLIKMPLDVTVKNTIQGGSIINKSGDVVYTDDAQFKIINDKIYRFKLQAVCMTVKEIKRVDGKWKKGDKLIVAYSDSMLYLATSRSNSIEVVEDFLEGEKREKNKIKVNGVWYDYFGDVLNS